MKWSHLTGLLFMLVAAAGCSGDVSSQTPVAKTPSHLNGPDALLFATQGGDLETVKSVLQQEPALKQALDYNGNSLLHIAAGYNREEIVAYLIAEGADPTLQNYDGLDCYEYADSENADISVLELLR